MGTGGSTLSDACIYNNNTSAALVMTWSVVPADLLHAQLEVLSLQNEHFPPICHRTCLKVCLRNIQCVLNGCPDPSAFTTTRGVIWNKIRLRKEKDGAINIPEVHFFSRAVSFPHQLFLFFFFLLPSSLFFNLSFSFFPSPTHPQNIQNGQVRCPWLPPYRCQPCHEEGQSQPSPAHLQCFVRCE